MKTNNDILGRIDTLLNNGNRRNAEQIQAARQYTAEQNHKREAIAAITTLLATVAAITRPVPETVYDEPKEAKRSKRQKQRRSRQHRLYRQSRFPGDDAIPKVEGDRIPESIVSPSLWERIPTSDTVFTYDENDGSILPIVLHPDSEPILGHCQNVPPQQSRSIRSASELNTFDRIGFLCNALRQLRDSTNNNRDEFEKVIAELSDADFLQSLRGFRRPLGYKRFSVRKSRKTVWKWNPNRRAKYLAKIENCRNGTITLRDGSLRTYKPMKIVIRDDGAPIVWRSIGWAKNELHKNPAKRNVARKGRAYRQLDTQIWNAWKKLEKCGVSPSQRDDFWAECEQQAYLIESANRAGFILDDNGKRKPFPPVVNSFAVAVKAVHFSTMRRLRLKEISAETDYSESGKRNLVKTPADAIREKLSGEERAVCYLMSQGITLTELAEQRTISRREVQTYAKKFRELGILK